MAYQSLDLGTSADDGTGDSLRVGGDKINDNFSEIYTLLGTGTALTSGLSATATVVTLSSAVGTFTTLTPASADGASLGSASLEFSDIYLYDSSVIYFGIDSDVTLTHVPDTGLLLNSTRQLQFGDSGTYIHQSADGVLDLVSDTELELNATTIDINGAVEISGTLAQVGVATFTARDIHSGGITIANGGQIGSVGDADAIAIASGGGVTLTQTLSGAAGTFSGILKTDDTTEATSTTDGSLQTDGGLSIVKDAVFGDDVKLLSDSAVLSFGADSDVTLTHAADTSLTLNVMMAATTFEPSGDTAAGDNAAIGFTSAEGLILTGQGSTSDVTIKNDADTTVLSIATGTTAATFAGDIKIGDNSSIGSASVTNAMNIGADGDITLTQDLELQHDGAILSFGSNDEVSLTHVHDTGLLLNSTSVIQFRDSALNIGSSADGQLDIAADTEVQITTATVDINGILLVDGSNISLDSTSTLNIDNSNTSNGITIGTATSGVPISIGHTTSEVTVNDNMTVTGTMTQTGISTSTAKDIFNAGMSTKNGATSAGFVEFFEDSDNGTNKVTVIGPASTADVTLTLPNSAGTIATTATAADEATALAIALG